LPKPAARTENAPAHAIAHDRHLLGGTTSPAPAEDHTARAVGAAARLRRPADGTLPRGFAACRRHRRAVSPAPCRLAGAPATLLAFPATREEVTVRSHPWSARC
jgi:hypothetical protein